MLSLKNIVVSDFKNDVTDFSDTVLRHFPDPHDRTPNDPLYFVSSDSVTKFANYLAQQHGLESVMKPSDITSAHALLLRNYAVASGWGNVHMAGHQMVLEAKFPTGNVDFSDTWTLRHGTSEIIVSANGEPQFPLTAALLETPVLTQYLGDSRAILSVTGASYINKQGFFNQTATKFAPSAGYHSRLVHNRSVEGLSWTIDLESGILFVTHPDRPPVDVPDLHTLEIEWTVMVPTQVAEK